MTRFERIGHALAWALSSPVVWALVFIVFGTVALILGQWEAGAGAYGGALVARLFFLIWREEERDPS